MKQIKKSQSGFTLVELVVVIVLLGILGVTALARFADLSSSAEDGAASGIATELTGASNINFANSLIGGTPTPDITGAAFACSGADALLQSGTIPADYELYAATSATDSTDTTTGTVNCTTAGGAGNNVFCGVVSNDGAAGTTDSATRGAVVSLICTN